MIQFLTTLAIVFAFLAISFVLINLRQIVTGKEFRGTCATNNPMLTDKFGECTVCGSKPDEDCKQPTLETNKSV